MRATYPIQRWLLVAIPAIFLQLILFKLFYPFASYFFADSWGYLFAAVSNQDANTWPIGYSKFLRVFNTFIHSDTGLVAFQYFFLQAAGLYFLFTIFSLFRPGRVLALLLFIVSVFNPLYLYLANCVSSDALFAGISFLWMGVLLRAMDDLSVRRIVLLALLVLAAFAFRYIAIYYPIVTVAGIWMSVAGRRRKWEASLFCLSLPVIFLVWQSRVNQAMTGVPTPSAFSGWQLANNAIYAYDAVEIQDRKTPPARFAVLDQLVTHCQDTAKYARGLFDAEFPGTYYIWDDHSPLVVYAKNEVLKDPAGGYYNAWTRLGPLYADYGAWLIRQYPGAFVSHYIWPNTIRYGMPPLEFMDSYNSRADTVHVVAQRFFQYRTNRVAAWSKYFQRSLFPPYVWMHLALNLFFLGSIYLFLTTRGPGKVYAGFSRRLRLMMLFWLVHVSVSIFSSPVVLRYEVFPTVLTLCFASYAVQYLLYWDQSGTPIKKTTNETKQVYHRRRRFWPDLIVRLRRIG